MRWIALTGLLLVLIMARAVLHIDLPIILMTPTIIGILFANLVAQFQIRQQAQVTVATLSLHFSFDVIALSWLLYCTGGANNPFAALLLLPLTMAAVALPTQRLWWIAGLAGTLYSTLVFYNIPLPPPQGVLKTLDEILAETCNIGSSVNQHGIGHTPPGSGYALHIAGMWVNFAISVLIVCTFLAKQAKTLNERDQALHDLRERALRQERALAIGLMAAGAAHKLGTPLSTLAVMISEAERDALNQGKPGQPEQAVLTRDELHLMRHQVDRCKDILSDMVAAATPQRRQALSASAWLAEWVDEWHVLRPTLARPRIRIIAPTSSKEPRIAPDRSIDQALQGLLDNAADALIQQMQTSLLGQATEDRPLEMELNWSSEHLMLEILDRGIGIRPEVAELLGAHFVSSDKKNLATSLDSLETEQPAGGLGIGFFLTNASLEQFGGNVELLPREGGGTRTRVILPIKALCLTTATP